MIHREPWFQRRFSFDLPVAAAPGLVERLRGTPARLEHRLAGLAVSQLTLRHGRKWSIQENAGHLGDLEPMWMARVEDLARGRDALEAADLENRRTNEARHNDHLLAEILATFRTARADLVRQLENADETDWSRSAVHPRLQTPMRLLDLAFFIAEHDDHHLATITDLLRLGPGQSGVVSTGPR
jgi:uncharacterized damage-inducible protein DinB